ncbi:MAG: RDD family protein [Armatimonadota bacterium]|nr:MAG: RDD family protein [Armatimonadota bacterium]
MPPQPAPPLGAPQTFVVPAEKVGFWTRFLASFIDGIIGAVGSVVIGAVLAVLGAPRTAGAISILAGIAYSVLLIGAYGQTVGMMALSIRVIRTDGTKVDYLIAFIRWIGSLLSAFVLCLGYLWIAFDPDKQAWHDKIAGTYVVRAQAQQTTAS